MDRERTVVGCQSTEDPHSALEEVHVHDLVLLSGPLMDPFDNLPSETLVTSIRSGWGKALEKRCGVVPACARPILWIKSAELK